MATKKNKSSPQTEPADPAAVLQRAQRSLKADEPHAAWRLATKGLQKVADATPELLAVIVKALESICSDLDEHGEDNLDLHGGGAHSEEDFAAFLAEARQAQRARRNPGAPPPVPLAPIGPAALTLGTPRVVVPQGGPPPLVTCRGFVARADAGAADLHDDDREIVVRDLKTGTVVLGLGTDRQRAGAVSADGRRIAVGRSRSDLGVFEADTGNKLATFDGRWWRREAARR